MSTLTQAQLQQRFSNTKMYFSIMNESEKVPSTVTRYPATAHVAVRFEKRMTNEKNEVINHENAILAKLADRYSEAKTAQIVTSSRNFEKNEHTVVTKSAGLDLFTWSYAPVKYEEKLYNNLFCHPLLLLKFLRGSLGALRSINAIGLIHCDLKTDQICLPFTERESTAEGKSVRVDFEDIRIIDFGFSLWNSEVPLPETTKYLLGDQETDNPQRYQSRYLIDHIKRYNNSQKGKSYDFTILRKIDYSVDIYGFGVLLKKLLLKTTEVIGRSNTEAWGVFIEELRAMRDMMLSFDTGMIPPYSTNRLPHTEFITKIEGWIEKVEPLTGHFSGSVEVILNREITKGELIKRTEELSYEPTPLSIDNPSPLPASTNPKEKQPNDPLPPIAPQSPLKQWLIGASVVMALGVGYRMLPIASHPNTKPVVHHEPVYDANKTVIDGDLQWQDNPDAKTVKRDWAEAKSYCENLTLDGYSDWRLPSYPELRTIVDYTKYNPAIKTGFKNTATDDWYWSASPNVDGDSHAWIVRFRHGNTDDGTKSNKNYVRCVRGRQ